jgi:hypothetical protein
MMAFFAGLLHATGKFGSAFHKPGASTEALFRFAVLASRVPAIGAALVGISTALPLAQAGAGWGGVAAPLVVLASCLLWAKADFMLLRGGSADDALTATGKLA